MTIHRFFVPSHTLNRGTVHLTGGVYDQIRRVLRMRVGDHVTLFDGSEYEYLVRLAEFGKGEIKGEVVERSAVSTEPSHRVDLYLSLLNKTEKFEWALQKCTELGAVRFVPVIAARSVTGAARTERWERIILEATEQSGRAMLPRLEDPLPLAQALSDAVDTTGNNASAARFTLMLEVNGDISLQDAIRSRSNELQDVAIFIGPEGGFTSEEQQAAQDCGIQIVKMGPRVMRAETAAIAAVTLSMAVLGEL